MLSQLAKKIRRGFTLVEIMIVVLIIGILLAVAIPNFIRARETSRAKSCQSNLQHIDAAKEQWAVENKKVTGDHATSTDLLTYIKTWPSCPSGGTYGADQVGSTPTCSIGTNGTADTSDDHVLQ